MAGRYSGQQEHVPNAFWTALIIVCALTWRADIACADSLGHNWKFLGESSDGSRTKVFLKTDAVEDWGDGNFFVTSLLVSPVTQLGIAVYDFDGTEHIDDRYPYKSKVVLAVYDCKRRLSAQARAFYYEGEIPTKDGVVYEEVENDPLLFPEIFIDPIFAEVCH